MSNNLRGELGRFVEAPPIYLDVQKFCKECNVPIVLKSNKDIERKNYCSRSCMAKGAAKTEAINCKRIINCKVCKKPFETTKWSHKYCSMKCCSFAAERDYKDRNATIEGFIRKMIRSNHFRANLTAEYLLKLYYKQDGKCALSGVKMTTIANSGKIYTNVSIDRINSSKGYEPDNIQLVCSLVNLMKHDLTNVGFVSWCRSIVRFHESKKQRIPGAKKDASKPNLENEANYVSYCSRMET